MLHDVCYTGSASEAKAAAGLPIRNSTHSELYTPRLRNLLFIFQEIAG